MIKSTYGTMYYVDNMDQAIAFYTKALGVEPGYRSEAWTEFSLGEHNLCLHAKRAGEKYEGGGVLIFNLDNNKAAFEEMRSKGFTVFGQHEVHPDAWSFHLKDESGNETSFYGKP